MKNAEVLKCLAQSGLLQDCQEVWLPSADGGVEEGGGLGTLSGRMTVGGHEFKLRVLLPEHFPLCLPEIRLEEVSPPIEIPHRIGDNNLCFTAGANLLDRRDPWAIVRESLAYVRNLLTDMLTGNRAHEFVQEIVAYWETLARETRIDCVVTDGERPCLIKAFFKGEVLRAVADDAEVYAQSLPTRSIEGLTAKHALYLPIDLSSAEPNFLPRHLLTLKYLQQCVQAAPEEDRCRLDLLLGHLDKREELVVLGVRRPHGRRALLGINLVDIRGPHPFGSEQAPAKVVPVHLMRRDQAFLAPRGGAGLDLRERRVLIAGCGSVGGYIALMLARAGIGGLTLVDCDRFQPDNTYRHACGMAWLSQPKVTGLMMEITRAIPYVSVKPYAGRVEDLLSKQPSVLREHHLVIAALGHPTIELHLNEWSWSDAKHPPILFTWLEPLGLGGHALLTHTNAAQSPERGCLECLYGRSIEGGPLRNRAAFAMPGATYTRDMLGCGSQYLPFADLDAQRTAELASRLALQALRGVVTGSRLSSWKGDRHGFEEEGYCVTPLYAAEPSSLESSQLTFVRKDCLICGET